MDNEETDPLKRRQSTNGTENMRWYDNNAPLQPIGIYRIPFTYRSQLHLIASDICIACVFCVCMCVCISSFAPHLSLSHALYISTRLWINIKMDVYAVLHKKISEVSLSFTRALTRVRHREKELNDKIK